VLSCSVFIVLCCSIPADILLVGSGIDQGTHAFIDTKDLDGETNLKPKSVPAAVWSVFHGV
jgi:magnesium-transporting ATPase (P-type)